MRFSKLQATGNDFVLLEADGVAVDWGMAARLMCDRRFGIGADGLLLLLPSSKADFRMRIINSDGSEAEICGNGLRCFARYLVDRGMAGPREAIQVETLAGVKKIEARPDGRFRVSMGRPVLEPAAIPVDVKGVQAPVMDYPVTLGDRTFALTFVSMGNPHAVCFVEDVEGFPLGQIGPSMEHHPIFPRRVNFEIVKVVSRSEVQARVWERGAGETLSCGSGACAVAVASILHNYVDHQMDIVLPGGRLGLEWEQGGEVYLSGEARLVFTGDWPDSL